MLENVIKKAFFCFTLQVIRRNKVGELDIDCSGHMNIFMDTLVQCYVWLLQYEPYISLPDHCSSEQERMELPN